MASKYLLGVEELTKKLQEMGKLEDGKALRAAVTAGTKPVLEVARGLIPEGVDAHRTYKGRLVAPGFAKRSIKARVSLSKDKQKASARIGVKKEAFYATQFVEIGTSKMAPQPWLRPAFQATLKEQQQEIAASLKKSVLKAAKK